MRRGLVAIALCLVGLVPVAQAQPTEPLGHSGRWITDASGRVVILHGFNTVPVNENVLPRDMGMGPDNAAWLTDNGFNTIRLGLFYARVEPHPGVFDPSYLDDFLRVQKELSDRGIFTLVDVHQDQFGRKYGDGTPINALPSRGFADWFAIDDGLPNTQTAYSAGYFVNPALNRAYDNLWNNTKASDGVGLQDHFARGWQLLAGAFKDRPRVLGYDLFNEPWPGSPYATCASPAGCPPGGFDQTLLTNFFKRITTAVRGVDRKHLVWYEPNLQFDFGAPTGVGPVPDAGGFTFHGYCFQGIANGNQDTDDTCGKQEEMTYDNAEAQSKRTGDALLLSEAGWDPKAAARMAAAADQRMFSWQWWDYYGDHNDFSKPSWPNLIRGYPQVTAGTPKPWTWDVAAKTLDYSYSTAAPNGKRFGKGARTEIFVPMDAYEVDLSGARVVSEPGARLLVLAQKRGAQTVTVRVRPEPRRDS
jgi:endoglycosylceramidase